MSLIASIRMHLGTLDLDLELEAPAGEVLGVVGPNGAGKTTLLRVLAGLAPLDGGRIELDGRVLDDPDAGVFVPPERRGAGYLFQDHLLFPHLSALENVAFGLQVRRTPAAASVAKGWLERVGLAAVAESRPAQLSGGQAQRIALARALAPSPRLLLLDEPLAALDASTKVDVRRELKRHLAAFEGITLMVTHDPVEAAALADRVLVLERGRATQTGSLAEITAHPRSRYVADLAGVNVWRGVAAGNQVQVAEAAIAVAGGPDGEVFALVQPRSVSVYAERPAGSPRNVWKGRVTSVEEMGDRVRLTVEGALTIVAELTAISVGELGIAAGMEVWVSFKAAEVLVYEA